MLLNMFIAAVLFLLLNSQTQAQELQKPMLILGAPTGEAQLDVHDRDVIAHTRAYRAADLQVKELGGLLEEESTGAATEEMKGMKFFASFAQPCHFAHVTGQSDKALLIREEMHFAVGDDGDYVIAFIAVPPAQDVTFQLELSVFERDCPSSPHAVKHATITVGPRQLQISSALEPRQSREYLVVQTGHSHGLAKLMKSAQDSDLAGRLTLQRSGRVSFHAPRVRVGQGISGLQTR